MLLFKQLKPPMIMAFKHKQVQSYDEKLCAKPDSGDLKQFMWNQTIILAVLEWESCAEALL